MAQEDQNGEVISFLGDIFTHRSSITVYGVYRGPIAARSYLKPEGQGDYDGAGSDEGRAYSGLWRNGRPRGTGWWRYPNGAVYAGEVLRARSTSPEKYDAYPLSRTDE